MRISVKNFFLFIFCSALLTFFLLQPKDLKSEKYERCGQFPREEYILWENAIWQVAQTSKGFVKLLSAHLDTRFNKTHVKVFANGPSLSNRKRQFQLFCQFWYENDVTKPFIVLASEIKNVRYQCE